MKKIDRIFSFIVTLVILITILWSLSFAEERKKYPPYPDVWERVFVDFTDNGLTFLPIGEEEVFIYQPIRVDRNGKPIKDQKNRLINLWDALLFFRGEVIRDFKKSKVPNIPQKIDKNIHSCGVLSGDFFSHYIDIKDGGKIRWIKGLVIDRINRYGISGGAERREINGILIDYKYEYPVNLSYHTTYYNSRPIILEKVDKDGRVLWQKVYLYFHPWWGNRVPRFQETRYDDFYTYFYFKLGCLALIDEERMFIYFDGTKRIFRLGSDGNPKTEDKNLIVMDYQQYRSVITEMIGKIDKFNKEQHDKGKSGLHCRNQVKDKERYYTISDYDYLGEQLCKKFSISTGGKEVQIIMGEYKNLDKCINNYNQLGDTR